MAIGCSNLGVSLARRQSYRPFSTKSMYHIGSGGRFVSARSHLHCMKRLYHRSTLSPINRTYPTTRTVTLTASIDGMRIACLCLAFDVHRSCMAVNPTLMIRPSWISRNAPVWVGLGQSYDPDPARSLYCLRPSSLYNGLSENHICIVYHRYTL